MALRLTSVLLISPEPEAADRIASWLADGATPCGTRHEATLRQARRVVLRAPFAAIFLDEAAAGGEEVRGVVRELARFAPVVAAVGPDTARDLSALVIAGAADCVPPGAAFLDLAAALIERRLLSSRRLLERVQESDRETELVPVEQEEFGSFLRHELNNPLTGILGNAEMLLHRRQWLPEDAVPRLETIADLAVRLRETIRRLSGAWEARERPQHIG
jgi:signal transduction histidine kinase